VKPLLLLAFVALAGESLAQSSAPVPAPDVRVQDSWKYRRVDQAHNRVLEPIEVLVTSLEGKTILTAVYRGGAPGDSRWTPEWNGITLDSGWVFTTESGLLKFPLQVGKSHEVAYEAEHKAYGLRLKFRGKSSVAGWEEVVVPAGKFQAVKIEINGRYDRFDKRGTSTDGADRRTSSTVQETIWYAPSVRRWVKRVYVDVDINQGEELVSFKVR
jgi:hypothetical protein